MLFQLMVNGSGDHGHHAQLHVEQELGTEQQTLAMDHITLECPVVALGQRLETVVVNLCSFISCQHKSLLLLTVVYLFADEGTWSAWDAWGTCSSSCGEGTRTRMRNVTGGQPCSGNSTDTQICPGMSEYSLFIIES